MLKKDIKIMITGGGSGGHLSVVRGLINALIQDYNIPKYHLCRR